MRKPQVVEQGDGNELIKFPIGSSSTGTAYMPLRIIQSAGKLWYTEQAAAAIGSITTAGVGTQLPVAGAFGGSTNSLTAGPGGAIWFTGNSSGYYIAYAAPGAAATKITLPAPTYFAEPLLPCPIGIAEGSDKAIWFTDPCNSAVGRVDPTTKQVTGEYQTPTANSDPQDLIEGPDGNLWIGEHAADTVARLTPKLAG